MPWQPAHPGEWPTLGFHVIDFIERNLAAPDCAEYEPFLLTLEQAQFVLRLHEVDPATGKRVVRRAVLSRPRGWGKSPFVSALLIAEVLADVVPDGWDANGQPVGRPWRTLRTPNAQLVGVSEAQTENAWVPLLEMLREEAPVHDAFPGIEPMLGQVNLPGGRGTIKPLTSSAHTVKGGKPVAVALDQTEVYYHGNGGVNLARTLRNNAAKLGGIIIETPNAYTPGEQSVAETTAVAYAASLASGKLDRGILYDHREAPPETEIMDRESLIHGLRVAYGDSSDDPRGCLIHDPPCPPGWVPIEVKVATIWDQDADEQLSRSDWLNQITHATDAYLSSPQWKNCLDDGKSVKPREIITLGFDGSRGRVKGKPDATALVGCRVSDGHLFEVRVWEADDKPSTWDAWEPDIVSIEAELARCFKEYRVAKFYCDPAKGWRSHVNAWEAKYSGQLVKLNKPGQQQHPFEWWMTGGRATVVERAVEQFYSAIAKADITHDGSAGLTRHMLNARRRLSHGKLALGKASSYSQMKIDAAVAAVLAYQGRLDALSAGLPAERPFYVPKRLY